MPSTASIVINTGPLIALVAALGDLTVLAELYQDALVPFEVCEEVLAPGPSGFAVEPFQEASWLRKWPAPLRPSPILRNSLDPGEAAVIQLALNEDVSTVRIDEAAGRRIARLSGLKVTGSIGVRLRAKAEGRTLSIEKAIGRMRAKGIWLSDRVVELALRQAGETPEPQS